MSAERIRVVHNGHATAGHQVSGGIERRGAPRFQTCTAGRIVPALAYQPVPCLITNISATGARVELFSGWYNPYQDPQDIGQQFSLVMRVDRLQVPCAIVHIDGTSMGVRFLRAPRLIPRAH